MTAEEIDKQVHELVESAYAKAKEILETHKEQLNVLAQILIDKEVIFADDLERIYGKRIASETAPEESKPEEAAPDTDKQDNTNQDGKE